MEDIKIRRRKTSAWWIKSEYEEVAQEFMKGPDSCISIADMSSFVPNKEIMKKAAAGQVAGQALYDFPDGQDNGMKPPVARMKGADIAEISEEIKKKQKDIKGKIDEKQAEKEAEARAKASLQAYKEAVKGSNTSE